MRGVASPTVRCSMPSVSNTGRSGTPENLRRFCRTNVNGVVVIKTSDQTLFRLVFVGLFCQGCVRLSVK